MTFGDAEWEARHGRTSAVDRWRYALAAVGAKMGLLVQSLRSSGSDDHDLRRLDLSRIEYPDTTCARVALEKLREFSSPSIANHSHRSYIWASLLGQLDGQTWDAEILYVAMMVHDIGLTASKHGSCVCSACFTLDSVNAVPAVFENTTPERAERIRRAVTLHLNITVPGEVHGWEAHYVRGGAAFDVVGERYQQLPPSLIEATLWKHPRLAMKEELIAWVEREAKLRPSSRMAMLRKLGFADLVNAAPYAS